MKKWQAWILPLVAIGLTQPVLAVPITLRLLQLNDVYEITPIEGGTRGGLARVATLRQQLLKENPRTYTILAGDSFSPFCVGDGASQRQADRRGTNDCSDERSRI